MSGLFGIVSKKNCVSSLYYGTDYHTHLGTEYGGIAFIDKKNEIPIKKIHDIANSQFKSKFYEGSDEIKSNWSSQLASTASGRSRASAPTVLAKASMKPIVPGVISPIPFSLNSATIAEGLCSVATNMTGFSAAMPLSTIW